MPYLIITDKQHELDRHELSGPAVVGRSPECDVVVRDVLLSRRHLRFERDGKSWVVTDLGSKNGTFIDGQKIDRHVLDDADIIRAGRTRFIFRAGAFVPPPPDVIERKAARRPADPIEALSGTMMGFELTDLEESSRVTGFPVPRPRPAEPVAEKRSRHAQLVDHAEHAQQVEHDLKNLPIDPEPQWNLELREPSPAEEALRSGHVHAHPGGGGATAVAEVAPRRVRSQTPQPISTGTPKWLALVYLVLAYLLCALVLWLLTWE
jgi:predicted component of type VI protein secretion system